MAHPGPYQQQAKPSAQQAKGSSRMGQNFIPFFNYINLYNERNVRQKKKEKEF